MRTVKWTSLIGKSFRRTKFVLFEPVLIEKWLKLIAIGVIAGTLTVGSLFEGFSQRTDDAKKKTQTTEVKTSADKVQEPVVTGWFKERPWDIKKAVDKSLTFVSRRSSRDKALIIYVAIVICSGLYMVGLWLAARFKFIWINGLIRNETAVKVFFWQYRKQGDSIFRVSIVSGIAAFVFFSLIGWYFVSGIVSWEVFRQVDWTSVMWASDFWAITLSIFSVIWVYSVWYWAVQRFVMPIMMTDGLAYLTAWDKFGRIYQKHRWDFWGFMVIFAVLSFVGSILQGVITIVIMILMVMLAAVIYGLGYLAFYGLLKSKVLFIGFSVGAGIPTVFAFVAVIFAVMLPFAVFSWNVSLYFLSSLNEGYAPLSLEETAVKKG